jgi:cell division protein FtsQ
MRGRSAVLSPRGAALRLGDLAEPLAAMTGQRLDRRRLRRRALRLARRLGRWGGASLVVATLAVAVGWESRWLLGTALFSVGRIEVIGQERLSAEAIVRASGITRGQSLWTLDARRAVAGVEALSLVRHVELIRAFPNRVTLLVEERRPFTLVQAAGKLVWVDEQGVAMAAKARPVSVDAPVISGLSPADLAPNGRVPSDRIATGLSLIRTLLRAQSPLLREISEVDVSRPEGPVLYMVDGVEVRLGRDDWGGRLGRLQRVAAQLRATNQSVTSIDLRFRDQVVLRTAAR